MKRFIGILLAAVLILSMTTVNAEEKTRVAVLKGPTGMAMSHIMANNDGAYDFTLAGAADELSALIINGSVDIAAVPVNLGAVLYNKTQGEVGALALITRGMLYVLEKGDSIHSVADLEGRTVVAAGQGATPEYVFNYILDTNGVKAALDFKSEHAEVTTLAVSGYADVILAPEPHVTSVLMKDSGFRVALDVTEEFAKAAALNGISDAQLSMSVVIVRREFYDAHPEQVARFMQDLEASIAFVNGDPAAAAQEIVAQEILASAAAAEKAIPSCQLVFVCGDDMMTQAAPLYDILFGANPKSVGGSVPDENYYLR